VAVPWQTWPYESSKIGVWRLLQLSSNASGIPFTERTPQTCPSRPS
jgi:hypothetical protein